MDDSLPRYLLIAIIVLLMIINALVVACKRALDYIDRGKIKDELEDHPDDKKLNAVTAFLSKPSKYHYADHAASFIMIIICFWLFNILLYGRMEWYFVLLANIGFFILYTALSDILPKKLATQSSESTGVGLIGFQRFIYVITLPFVWICKGIADLILTIMGKEKDVDDAVFSEERIMSMLDRGHESGEIDAKGIEMIDSIFEFDDLLAYEIMTPRTDVFMIDVNGERNEYFDELMELRHSRIPVFEDDPDKIIGILHIKDYLHNATKKGFDKVNIRKLLRPAYFVPETKNVDALFREMQKEKQHLAMLIDEYGGFSGIVSVEDIIEQIVGDIDDEFDEEDRIIEKVNDTTYIVDGNVYLDDLEEEAGVKLESDTSETINGFITDHMGEIPRENIKYDSIEVKNYKFTILEVKDRRIEKLRIEIMPEEENPDDR